MNEKYLIDLASGHAYDSVFGTNNEKMINTNLDTKKCGEVKTDYCLTYQTLKNNWEKYLKPKGVKMPRFKGKLGFSLCILAANMDKFMHIDEIKTTLLDNNFKLTGTDPVQVRHLSTQSGWWIEKEGKYKHKLCSMEKPLPGFISQKRANKLNICSWNALKLEYQNKCVNCGSKENEPMRWDQTKITVLQQGHMDPRKDLVTNNCIPQCSFCNQAYKNKAIFNKRGIVIDFLKSGF